MKKAVKSNKQVEKISDEMLEKLNNVVNGMTKVQLELGKLEVRKHELLHHHAMIQDEATLLQRELEDKYGTYDVNVIDGTINRNGDGK